MKNKIMHYLLPMLFTLCIMTICIIPLGPSLPPDTPSTECTSESIDEIVPYEDIGWENGNL